MHYRREAALKAVAEGLKAAGVKTAWQVGFEPQPMELSVLEGAGFASREVIISKTKSSDPDVSTVAWAQAWFERVLGTNSPRLPDFLYFSDDGVCQGALLAFLKNGIRIPEDVRVQSWSNNGKGPYGYDSIARAQISTSENAATVAENLLSYLKEGKCARVVELATELVCK